MYRKVVFCNAVLLPLPWNNCPALPAGSGPHLDHCTWKKDKFLTSTILIAPVFQIRNRPYLLGLWIWIWIQANCKDTVPKIRNKCYQKSDLVWSAGKNCPQKTKKFHVRIFLWRTGDFFNSLELLHYRPKQIYWNFCQNKLNFLKFGRKTPGSVSGSRFTKKPGSRSGFNKWVRNNGLDAHSFSNMQESIPRLLKSLKIRAQDLQESKELSLSFSALYYAWRESHVIRKLALLSWH